DQPRVREREGMSEPRAGHACVAIGSWVLIWRAVGPADRYASAWRTKRSAASSYRGTPCCRKGKGPRALCLTRANFNNGKVRAAGPTQLHTDFPNGENHEDGSPLAVLPRGSCRAL